MRHWKTKLAALCAAAAMLLPMTGCSLTASAEELFTLPEFPVEYTGLSNQLNALLGQGYEYVSPSSGRNIQSVQMTDLNGDGYEEAVAFFRAPSGEKPLKIVIFRPTEDSFEQLCTIESSGSAINRVSYQDLNGDGRMELVVGWRISADVQTVAVYEIAPDPVVLMQSSYQSAILQDLDGDGVMDLLVIHAGTKGNGVMDFYHWQVGEQKPVASDCALMRRSGGAPEESSGEISQPPFLLNTRNRTLEKNGQRIKLTQVEYSIMRMFMENPGKALSREEILDMVWGRNYFGELKIVDVNIRRLRLKIEDNATNPVYITTVWGYGYKWGF